MKTTIKKVVINGTVYLDSHVFYQCQNLETVVLNGTITNKFQENYHSPVSGGRGWLFDECTKLKNVIINGTIETDLDCWFLNCTSLESFTLPENLALVDGLELDGTFSGCVNLTQFKLGNNRNFSVSDDGRILYTKDRKTLVSYPSATVPASIASLGTDVFGNCQNITTITIHNKFKSVSDFYPAFSDCRNLQTINFHGTQKEWERLMATANEWEAAKLQNVTVNIIPQWNDLACRGRFFSRIPQALLLIYCSCKSKKRPFGRAQVIYGTEIVNLPLLSSEPDGVGKQFLA